MKIRVKFTKHGPVKFIGHLDMMRYFQKAVRRCSIPAVYTEGFNPHQIMSFASPLGVGLESNGEYFDMEVAEVSTSQDMMRRLNAVMAEGIAVVSIKALPEGAGNAMASVAAADYTVTFRKGYEPLFDPVSQIESFRSKAAIPVIKQAKKSGAFQEMDLKPHIYQLLADGHSIFMRLDASSAGSVKPSFVMEAIYREAKETLPEFALEITREELYADSGSADAHVFVPLDALGAEII